MGSHDVSKSFNYNGNSPVAMIACSKWCDRSAESAGPGGRVLGGAHSGSDFGPSIKKRAPSSGHALQVYP